MAADSFAVGAVGDVLAVLTLLADVLRLAAALVSDKSGCGLRRARPAGCLMACNDSSFSKLSLCCLFAEQLVLTK